MHVLIFEGSRWPAFAPLSLSRPVFTLVSGMHTLLIKQMRHLKPSRITLWIRPELEEHCRLRLCPDLGVPTTVNTPLDDEPTLLINGRTLLLSDYAPIADSDEFVVIDDSGSYIREAYVRRPGLSPADLAGRTDAWTSLLSLPRREPQHRLVESLWDLIHWNEESLIADSVQMADEPPTHPAGPYHMVREQNVHLGEGVTPHPGVVLDASRGPIVIEKGTTIGANAVIQGPVHIGLHSQVAALAHIRPGTSVGTLCRVGGEVSNSIIHGYSNKGHYGYLGDSYLGRWVNFGAGTTTSNLKNTYGEVTVRHGEHEYRTGRRFLGALIGDHTRTGIGTRFSAGAYVGFGCSVASSSIAPSFLPSYSFVTDRGVEPYDMEKAIEVTRRVYSRRDRPLTETDERIMRYVQQIAQEVEGGDGFAQLPPNLE
jgi:UDP-N-acetylglucosamine diphosphorylase/glucosamine-1-phosphate N-acetyltransferase